MGVVVFAGVVDKCGTHISSFWLLINANINCYPSAVWRFRHEPLFSSCFWVMRHCPLGVSRRGKSPGWSYEVLVDPESVADPISSLSGYNWEEECNYPRDQVQKMYIDVMPQVQTQPTFHSLSFGKNPLNMDTLCGELGLLLAPEAHKSFCEIVALITGSDCTLQFCLRVKPIWSADSYLTLGASFLDHPAVISTRVVSECHFDPVQG